MRIWRASNETRDVYFDTIKAAEDFIVNQEGTHYEPYEFAEKSFPAEPIEWARTGRNSFEYGGWTLDSIRVRISDD